MILAGAALAIALSAAAAPSAASATANGPPGADLDALYVRARAASILGDEARSAALLGDLTAARPADARIALTAFRSALLAGDHPLASRGAARLAALGPLPADAMLLQLDDALAAHDRKAVEAALERLQSDRGFAFMAPVLRAWCAVAVRSGDPMKPLLAATGPGAALAVEQRPLILLAQGHERQGLVALDQALGALNDPDGARAVRLRIAAASVLARHGHRREAADRLKGDDGALSAARALLAAGKPIPGAIDTAQAGIADVLAGVASDLARNRADPAALALARLATFFAPDDADAWLVTASILAMGDRHADALAALDHVAPADPLADRAGAMRVQLLVLSDDKTGALSAAQALVAREPDADDYVALGNVQSALGDDRAAAGSYGRARGIAAAAKSQDLWTFDMLQGGALDEAGDWQAAEPLLARAVKLAPDQPVALNYLGYSRLEKGQDVAASTALIEKAHRLAPENGAITDSLGWAHYRAGDVRGAVPLLEAAVAAAPGDATINEHLGDAYWAAGRRYEARFAWRAAGVYADPKDKARLAAKIARGPEPALAEAK